MADGGGSSRTARSVSSVSCGRTWCSPRVLSSSKSPSCPFTRRSSGTLPQLFALMQSRGGQQILLSTHSPDLLRDEGIGLDEVLLLLPGDQGTEVRTAASFPEIVALLEGDMPLGEVILPKTRPEGAHTFALRARR